MKEVNGDGAIKNIKQRIKQTNSLLEKILKISSQINFEGIERVNRTTLFHVKIKHTNEFVVQLGAGYFAEVRSEEAIKLYKHRLQAFEEELKRIEVQKAIQANKDNKQINKYSKQKTVKLQEGNKRCFMEVVGQQNGEDIFNIVQIEGQEQDQKSQLPVESTGDKQIGLQTNEKAAPVLNLPTIKQQIQAADIKNECKNEIRSDGEESEQEQEMKEEQDKEEGETNDIIIHHRNQKFKKVDYISTEQATTNPAVPKVQIEKQKKVKRVSFALQTNEGEDDEQKRQVKTEQQIVKIKAKKVTPKKDQLPSKMSRFKLERMKERLEKDLKQ